MIILGDEPAKKKTKDMMTTTTSAKYAEPGGRLNVS